MATVLILTPRDHGRPMSREEFESSQGAAGYRFELIDGKVYVSPAPNLPHDRVVVWLTVQLVRYSVAHPDVLNYITNHPRVPVPDRPETTIPEPDLAAYPDFPLRLPLDQVSWDDVSPILVAEVVSEDDPDKDRVRNVRLYEQVPSIREYWLFDPLVDPGNLSLRVYRRRGRSWQRPIDVAPGATYTTRLLPGFTLRVDPLG